MKACGQSPFQAEFKPAVSRIIINVHFTGVHGKETRWSNGALAVYNAFELIPPL